MGASDWAGRMCRDLEDEFDICGDRALRLTTLIRRFGHPEYEGILGDHEEHRDKWPLFRDYLVREIRQRDGETIEQRWNTFIDDVGYPDEVEGEVYLIPWDEYDADDWTDPGVTATKPA